MNHSAAGAIWRAAGLAPEALERLTLTGGDPVLPSSFAVGRAAQASIAVAALAAIEIGQHRGSAPRRVALDMWTINSAKETEHSPCKWHCATGVSATSS